MPPNKPSLTAQAAEFAEALQYSALPEDVTRLTKRCILDGLGLFVSGLSEEGVRLLREHALEQGGKQEALLLGAGAHKVPAAAAARVLGTAGHAQDWDDTQVSSDPNHIYGLLTHPTIPLLAAALAVAQRRGTVTGAALLAGFQAGFEVECKLAEWMPAELYRRSFHSSGVVGVIGACVTAAKLATLDVSSMRRAIGIAASMASGIRANFGTMTKPLHVGRAAENGVIAAELAGRGFEANADALDGPWGYCCAYAGGISEEKATQGFGGTAWSIVNPGVSIKPYPSGILTHQSMDAMLRLVTAHALQAEDIDHVVFYAGSNILGPIRYAIAEDHLQAKFCMPALLAMIILRRAAGRQEFTTDFVRSEPMQHMQRRIATRLDARIEEQGKNVIRSRIELHTKDGRKIVQWADERYRGGPQLPFTDDDLRRKFEACVDGFLSPDRQERVIEAVDRLETLSDVAILAGLIQPRTDCRIQRVTEHGFS